MKLHAMFSMVFIVLSSVILGGALFFPSFFFFAKNITIQGGIVVGGLLSLLLVVILLLTYFKARFLYRSRIFQATLFVLIASGVSTLLSTSVWQSFSGFALETETFIFLSAFLGWIVASFLFLRVWLFKTVCVGIIGFFVGALNVVLLSGLLFPNAVVPYLPEASTVGFLNGVVVLLCSAALLKVTSLQARILLIGGVGMGLVGLFIVGLPILFMILALSLATILIVTFFSSQKMTYVHGTIGVFTVLLFVSAFLLPLSPDRFPGNTAIRPGLEPTFTVIEGTLQEGPLPALFGSGPNTFSYAWNLHKSESVATTLFWNADFHTGINFYTTVFVSNGLLGLFSWLVLLGTLVLVLIKYVRKKQTSLALFLFGATLFTLLWFSIDVPNGTILMLVALIIGGVMQYETRTMRFSEPVSLPKQVLRVGAGVIVSVFLLAGIYTAVQVTRSAMIFETAALQFSQSENGRNVLVGTVRQAIAISEHANYYRFLAELRRIELDQLLQAGITTEEELNQAENMLEDIVRTAQNAVERDPNNYLHHITLGNMYTQRVLIGRVSDLDAAVGAYQTAQTLSPQNPIPPYLAARVLLLNNQVDEAKIFLEESLQIKPDYTPARSLLPE